jgi:hypothetical protein
MAIADELENDLKWREAELAVLKASTIGTPQTDARGRSMRRAYLSMLYAHYEGFAQFAWQTYLLQLRKTSCAIQDLCPELQVVFSSPLIGELRKAERTGILDKVRDLVSHLAAAAKPEMSPPETANLWPDVYIETASWLGLPFDYVEEHRQDLKALVSRRNDVAHGKKMEVDDAALKRLENAVWSVLMNLSVDMVDRLEKQMYLAAH